jgi:general L-amino acid transport system substrate-binding protein
MMKLRLCFLICLLLAAPASLLAQPEIPPPAEPGPTLARVQARGQVVCGVNEDVFGFGFLNPNTGSITGINVDFCAAVAAAVFGDSTAVDLRLLAFDAAPDALLSGELDLALLHNFTHTLAADSSVKLAFGPPLFYDGQSIMVRADSGIEGWPDVNGETICTVGGVAETSIRDALTERGLRYDLLTFPSIGAMQEAFLAGRCTVQTLERSILEIRRQMTDVPTDYVVWEQPFTRVVKGPVYRYGDKQWSAIINWTLWGLIHAEELGITSENLSMRLRQPGETDDAYIARVGRSTALLLDDTLGIGSRLGLANNFMVPVIRQVGNYGEIYNRHLGASSALPISRSLNNLWGRGGLLQAPPWR